MLRRLEKLKAWRKKAAEEMKVESDIILPRPYLLILAEQSDADVRIVLKNSPGRLERFGAQLKQVLGG